MITYKPSATSPGGLEEVQLAQVLALPPKLRIEVPDTWHAVFSSQNGTLTVEPLAEVSLSELSSQVKSMSSRRI